MVPEALVALSDGTLFAVSTELVEEMPLKSTASMPVVDMALGADENILACFTKRGHLHIFDVVTKTCLYVIDTSIQKPPNQLIWCGMRVRPCETLDSNDKAGQCRCDTVVKIAFNAASKRAPA